MNPVLSRTNFRPKTCVMEITFSCNMKCLHCASDINSRARSGTQLSRQEFLQAVTDLKELGCEHLVVSGGEALLSDDWRPIVEHAKKQDLYVSIISNGLIINPELAREIRSSGIDRVAISIDGAEDTHNRIRGNDQSFSRATSAILALRDEGVPFNFITTVTKLNMGELEEIEEYASKMGADYWLIQIGTPLGRLSRNQDIIIAPTDLPRVADFIVAARSRNKVKVSVGDNIGYFSPNEQALRRPNKPGNLDFFCGCFAGCLVVGIESNGNVKGCLSLQDDSFIEGNIRNRSLRDIWTSPDSFKYTRGFKPSDLHGTCSACEYGEICRGGCTFIAFASTGAAHDNPYCLHHILQQQSKEMTIA